MNYNEISKRIKSLRAHYNLSQSDLADIAKVTKAAISRWERGEIANLKSTTIRHICDYYQEINPAWLLGGNVPMFKQSKEAESLASEISEQLSWLDEEQLRKLKRFIDEWL